MLSFWGAFAWGLLLTLGLLSELAGVALPLSVGAIVIAIFYAAPLIGGYALYKVIRLAEPPKSVAIFLAALGFCVDIWVALFWLTLNF